MHTSSTLSSFDFYVFGAGTLFHFITYVTLSMDQTILFVLTEGYKTRDFDRKRLTLDMSIYELLGGIVYFGE